MWQSDFGNIIGTQYIDIYYRLEAVGGYLRKRCEEVTGGTSSAKVVNRISRGEGTTRGERSIRRT